MPPIAEWLQETGQYSCLTCWSDVTICDCVNFFINRLYNAIHMFFRATVQYETGVVKEDANRI